MIQLPPNNLRISQSNSPLENYENFPLPVENYEALLWSWKWGFGKVHSERDYRIIYFGNPMSKKKKNLLFGQF